MARNAHLSSTLADLIGTDWRERFGTAQRQELAGIVRAAFIDTAACILAGREQAPTRIASGWAASRFAASDEATLLFGDRRGQCRTAALVNAVSGHALDYDDVGLAGHPSVVLMPALWAEHERAGVRGFDLVQAYAKGFAVWSELLRRQRIALHERGWHPTAVFGVVAVAAAVGSLRHLTTAQAAHSLGIAASLAGGVIANFGSMMKPLHAGLAAEGGITAVELSQAGLDASPDALNGPAGLLHALAGAGNVECDDSVGIEMETALLRSRPGIKKYPVCYAAHRIVDGVLDLRHAHRVTVPEILRVDAYISRTNAGVLRHHAPRTVDEALFSLEFCVAAALTRGKLGIAEVSVATLDDPAVRELMPRVHTRTVPTHCPIEPSFALTDRVTLTLRDNAMLDSGPIRFARGHAELPLDEAGLHEKLKSCAGESGQRLAASIRQRIDAALDADA